MLGDSTQALICYLWYGKSHSYKAVNLLFIMGDMIPPIGIGALALGLYFLVHGGFFILEQVEAL